MNAAERPCDANVVALPDIANTIVERAMTNMRRKLVGGYRNKKNSRPNAKTSNPKAVATDTLNAASADSVLSVAQRGQAWKEMIQKSLTSGISSLSTMEFDGSFTIKGGVPSGLTSVPNSPGVYVVYDNNNKPLYVGDSVKLQQRWHAGHLNEYKQGQRSGDGYKLDDAFENGCTVRYIRMESEETAAALEAHLIKVESPPINAREELKTEQGKRSNIEAKKIKDASGSTASLVGGAAKEATANFAFSAFEQLGDAVCFALKDELVDIVGGGKATVQVRIERFLRKIWNAIKALVAAPLKLLSGLVEFIVNALSKAIGQIYALVRNLCDLAQATWNLYRGAQTMSKEELIRNISETILITGTLVIFDALDPLLEAQLVPLIGPAAPYVSAALSAIGFGIASYALHKAVPVIVKYLVNLRTGWHDALDAERAVVNQLLAMAEREIRMLGVAVEYVKSTEIFVAEVQQHTRTLSQHSAIEPLDVQSLLRDRPGKKGSAA